MTTFADHAPLNVHATGLVLGATGLLLRGPSGAGKSILALDLLNAWEARGLPAKLVSDDRVEVSAEKSGLMMRPPKPIEGLIELRGRGIVSRPFTRKARLHLVVDLVDSLVRMPEEEALSTELCGVTLARCPVPRVGLIDARHQFLLIKEAITVLPAPRQKTT